MGKVVKNIFLMILPLTIGISLLAHITNNEIQNPIEYFMRGLSNLAEAANVWQDWIGLINQIGAQLNSLTAGNVGVWQAIVNGINLIISFITLPLNLLGSFLVRIGVLLYQTAVWIFLL